ncbi:hypothetical protein HispidOSU_021517, partial [Sigmodon hispidus]
DVVGTVISMESLAVSSARLISVQLTEELNNIQVTTPTCTLTSLGNCLGSQKKVKVSASILRTTGNTGAYRPLLLK